MKWIKKTIANLLINYKFSIWMHNAHTTFGRSFKCSHSTQNFELLPNWIINHSEQWSKCGCILFCSRFACCRMVKITLWLHVPIAQIISQYNILKLPQHGQEANIFHVPCRFEQQRNQTKIKNNEKFIYFVVAIFGRWIFVMRWKFLQIYVFSCFVWRWFFPK